MSRPDRDDWDRRPVIGAGLARAAGAASAQGAAGIAQIPIIDGHIHLFDGTRPQGAPRMGSRAKAAAFKHSLPPQYRAAAAPAGTVGAVVVEASAWVEDNLWLLEVAQTDPMIVGISGRLDRTKPEFVEYLERYSKSPLYRGIHFYNQGAGKVLLDPVAAEGLKRLAKADLVLDSANPSMPLPEANLALARAVPELRQIVDHLPSMDPTPENRTAYEAVVKGLAEQLNVFVKLSQVYHPRNGVVATEWEPLRDRLEYLYAAFGEDRLMYGSDYPNSYGIATIPETIAVMRRFYATKSKAAAEKYFWKNSARVYKWVKIAPDQPSPV
jgi:L-fuconolactonase